MVTLITNFAGLVLFCTLVMVMDFLVKRAKYSRWKVRLHMLCEDDFYNRRCFVFRPVPDPVTARPPTRGSRGRSTTPSPPSQSTFLLPALQTPQIYR
jgi:hypothetical protein